MLLFGAATLWQSGRPEDRYAHVLLLDPKTGKTLQRQILDGGYAVPALLSGGRVAVATLDSCPDGKGGSITVFDATLERVVTHARARALRRGAPRRPPACGSCSARPRARRPSSARNDDDRALGDGKLVESADGTAAARPDSTA